MMKEGGVSFVLAQDTVDTKKGGHRFGNGGGGGGGGGEWGGARGEQAAMYHTERGYLTRMIRRESGGVIRPLCRWKGIYR